MSLFQTRRHVLGTGIAAFAALVLATGLLPAAAAFDSYLTFGDGSIQGAGPNNSVYIESFSWGMGQQTTVGTAGGGGTGKVSHGSLQITKTVDVASPKLQAACASGKHFPKLSLSKDGTTTVFDDVTIVSVHPTGGSPPMETLMLSYANIEAPGKPLTTIDTHPIVQPGITPAKKP